MAPLVPAVNPLLEVSIDVVKWNAGVDADVDVDVDVIWGRCWSRSESGSPRGIRETPWDPSVA